MSQADYSILRKKPQNAAKLSHAPDARATANWEEFSSMERRWRQRQNKMTERVRVLCWKNHNELCSSVKQIHISTTRFITLGHIIFKLLPIRKGQVASPKLKFAPLNMALLLPGADSKQTRTKYSNGDYINQLCSMSTFILDVTSKLI